MGHKIYQHRGGFLFEVIASTQWVDAFHHDWGIPLDGNCGMSALTQHRGFGRPADATKAFWIPKVSQYVTLSAWAVPADEKVGFKVVPPRLSRRPRAETDEGATLAVVLTFSFFDFFASHNVGYDRIGLA